jgi:hypothetical protein
MRKDTGDMAGTCCGAVGDTGLSDMHSRGGIWGVHKTGCCAGNGLV